MNAVLVWVAACALLFGIGSCDEITLFDLGLESVWQCHDDDRDESHTGNDDDCISKRSGDEWCPNPKQEYECNCGCGAYDPDCSLPTRFRPKNDKIKANMRVTCSPGGAAADGRYTFCQKTTASCFTVPLDWTCEPRYYDEGSLNLADTDHTPVCHCDCGVWDPDCDIQGNEGVVVRCNTADGEYEGWSVSHTHQVCTTERICMAVPESWTCPITWYNEVSSGLRRDIRQPVCDCGCGAVDPDCEWEHKRSTEGLEVFGLSCNGTGNLENSLNRYCNLNDLTCADAPDGWTCPGRYYNENASNSVGPNEIPDCHCGCGVMDPDCDLALPRRNGKAGLLCKGANSDEENPSATDMALNNYCVYNSTSQDSQCTTAPTGWSPRCVSSFYDEIGQGRLASDARCDCACGVWDPDCDNTDTILFCNPDQSSSAPSPPHTSKDEQWCSRSTVTCVTSPLTNAMYNGTATATQFNEVINGPAPGRSKPSCDCGTFDEFDPDCLLQILADDSITTTCSDNEFCDYQTNDCVSVPAEWTCPPALYNQLENEYYGEWLAPSCDCGCGVWDPDCNSQVRRHTFQDTELFGLTCWDDLAISDLRTAFCQFNTNTCDQAPSNWYGAPEWFNETRHGTLDYSEIICHCGLGLYDPDCEHGDLNVTWCGTTRTSQKCNPNCPNCVVTTSLSKASTLATSFSFTFILFFCSLLTFVVM